MSNAAFLNHELAWVGQLVSRRIAWEFEADAGEPVDIFAIEPGAVVAGASFYEEFLLKHQFGFAERAILGLALAPNLQPELLDDFYARNLTYDRRITQFGGVYGIDHAGFLPTVETVLFVLAGHDLEARFGAMKLFEPDHAFAREGILTLEPSTNARNEPLFSRKLVLDHAFVDQICFGGRRPAGFSADFPARRLTTGLDWADAVFMPATLNELTEVSDWLEFGETLRRSHGMGRWIQPGLRCLFHGPSGTGKTLAVSLLGKKAGRDVYRVDLSMIVSKWIGETEKNLARIFDRAEGEDWVLFFDEADALFGKRTETSSAHDRYANQEVSYLLQRIEQFDGLAILATNMKENIDSAFLRRFQAMVPFPIPGPAERLRLWVNALPKSMSLAPDVDLEAISQNHEITGGMIVTTIARCAIQAIKCGSTEIGRELLAEALRKELSKAGYFS